MQIVSLHEMSKLIFSEKKKKKKKKKKENKKYIIKLSSAEFANRMVKVKDSESFK